MFVVSRRVVDIKEVKELSPDVDIGSSDSQNKAQEVNTPHLCGLHRLCSESQHLYSCVVSDSVSTCYVCTLLDYNVQTLCNACVMVVSEWADLLVVSEWVDVMVVSERLLVFANSNPFFLSSSGGSEGKIRTAFVRLT